MLIPSICELFQAYPAAAPAATKISLVPLFSTTIVTTLSRNQWNFSTSNPLCFLLARISYLILNALHIAERKLMSGSCL